MLIVRRALMQVITAWLAWSPGMIVQGCTTDFACRRQHSADIAHERAVAVMRMEAEWLSTYLRSHAHVRHVWYVHTRAQSPSHSFPAQCIRSTTTCRQHPQQGGSTCARAPAMRSATSFMCMSAQDAPRADTNRLAVRYVSTARRSAAVCRLASSSAYALSSVRTCVHHARVELAVQHPNRDRALTYPSAVRLTQRQCVCGATLAPLPRSFTAWAYPPPMWSHAPCHSLDSQSARQVSLFSTFTDKGAPLAASRTRR